MPSREKLVCMVKVLVHFSNLHRIYTLIDFIISSGPCLWLRFAVGSVELPVCRDSR
jgi:hypothetical protein